MGFFVVGPASSASPSANKRGSMRRNFSYQYSLDKVLKKGNGLDVIEEYLCTWNDAGSTSSWNSNNSVGTVRSIQSQRSNRSLGQQSTRSKMSTRSAMNVRGYQQRTGQSSRTATGNIDQMLQHMLSATNDEQAMPLSPHGLRLIDEQAEDEKDVTNDEEKERMENPKYAEYKHLYLVVRDRVCNAKVLSFAGETRTYQPFHWMNEQLTRHKQRKLEQQKGANEATATAPEEDTKDSEEEGPTTKKPDENVPSNVYRLLGVGILSTFLPSAILGGHLIDTTPLIDSNELETAMNTQLALRKKILNVFQHAFGSDSEVSLQRWFAPNRDQTLVRDKLWTQSWLARYRRALAALDWGAIDSKSKVSLVSPLKMLAQRESKGLKVSPLKATTALEASQPLPEMMHISQLLAAAYLGTLVTLEHVGDACALTAVASALSKVSKFEFETVLAIEMLRHGDLSAKAFTLIDENQKEYKIDELHQKGLRGIASEASSAKAQSVRRLMRLICRCCSLLPMRPFIDGKRAWEAQLSHSLAAFNHVTTTYHHGLRNCIEACITWLYCRAEQEQMRCNAKMTSPAFLKELALSLKQLPPEPCTGMGVLIGAFVTEFAKVGWAANAAGLDEAGKGAVLKKQLDALKAKFPVFTRHRFAIQCSMQFFYQICTLVKELGDAQVLDATVVSQFEDAYEYLSEVGVWEAVYFMELNQSKKEGKVT